MSPTSNRSKAPTQSASGSGLGTYKPFCTKEVHHTSPQALSSDYQLENAIEDEPNKVFVKQEIPFELGLASSLLDELSTALVEELEGYSQSVSLPDLGVQKLDDITSGLALLRDYISARSRDVSKANTKQVISELRATVTELESQLSDALTGRDILQARLEVCEISSMCKSSVVLLTDFILLHRMPRCTWGHFPTSFKWPSKAKLVWALSYYS